MKSRRVAARASLTPLCRAPDRHDTARISGPGVLLEWARSGAETRRLPGLLQRGTEPRVLGRPHAVRRGERTPGSPCGPQQHTVGISLPGPGSVASGGLIRNSRPTGVRPGREPTSRGRQHVCDRPSDGPFPPHHRAMARASLDSCRVLPITGCCAISTSLSCRRMNAARSSAASAAPCGCLRRSRCVPGLWAGSVLGRRSHRNTKAAINDVILRGRRVGWPLIAIDGFEYIRRGDGAPLGFSVRLWASAQDAAEQSCRCGSSGALKIGTASRLNRRACWRRRIPRP